MIADLMQELAEKRLEHLGRVMVRTREAWLRASAELALLRGGGWPPEAGLEGDRALKRARAAAEESSVAPSVIREHPVEAMFRRAQLRPEWRWLYDRYAELCEIAEGGSAGVSSWEGIAAFEALGVAVQTSRAVPQFRTGQLEAVHAIEDGFRGPIRRKAGEKAEAVFDVTHRFGRQLVSVMSVSQLGADGRFGARKKVGQLLQRAYEALADHWGITAAQARARYRRDDDARGELGIVAPLTAAERAEIAAHQAAVDAEVRARAAARFQDGKAHAMALQRQRRAGQR
jgi:hypothetical protein